jgi:CBS domain containing-hemolysin-like protein
VVAIDGTGWSTVLPLAAFVALTAANAFFVVAEYSLVTADRAEIERQAATGDRRARVVVGAFRRLSFQLSGAQLGVTLSALLTGYLAQPALAKLLDPAVEALPLLSDAAADTIGAVLALVLATLFSMLFGELIPKNATLARPMGAVRAVTPVLRGFTATFGWLIRILNGSANAVVRRLGVEPQEELASARSPEELGLLAATSARAGALPRETAMLLQRTIRFDEKRAAEAMTPRVDVVALPSEATVTDLFRAARESGRSRFPVYVDTLDQIVGVAVINDALAVPPAQRDATLVRRVAREPVFVPDSLDLDGVLSALREANLDLAVVVDEYGGTDGVVTTEDLVEELVGEIEDEYDPDLGLDSGTAGLDAAPFAPSGRALDVTAPRLEPTRLVSGLLREDELAEQVGFRLPEGPFETLAGFLMARLGHIPVDGETLEYQGWEFTVTSVDRHRIEQVQVRPPADWQPPREYVPESARGEAGA